MKKRFSEEQIAFALRRVDMGVPVAEVPRKMGISELRNLKQLYVDREARGTRKARRALTANWVFQLSMTARSCAGLKVF